MNICMLQTEISRCIIFAFPLSIDGFNFLLDNYFISLDSVLTSITYLTVSSVFTQVATFLYYQEKMNILVEPEVHDVFARIPGFGFVQTFYSQDTRCSVFLCLLPSFWEVLIFY